MMNKKIFCMLLSVLMLFILNGCGTPKLEDKQEKANYANMKNGTFNAKYTNLDSIRLYNTYDDNSYPNKKAFTAYDKENNRFNIIFSGVDKDKELKTTFGTKLGGILYKDIKINKAEVVAERLNSKKYDPTLLVDISDIESIDENKFQTMLESNKTYEQLMKDEPAFNAYIMSVKDGDLKYDPKYADRVAILIKADDEEMKKMNADIASQPKQQTENNNSASSSSSSSETSSSKPNDKNLRSGQSIVLNKNILVCSSKDNLDKMLSFMSAKNEDGQNQMLLNGQATILSKGTKVNVIDAGIAVTKIETLNSETWFAPREMIEAAL